jgi:hypothetical protein
MDMVVSKSRNTATHRQLAALWGMKTRQHRQWLSILARRPLDSEILLVSDRESFPHYP